jgi:hypothetical protein
MERLQRPRATNLDDFADLTVTLPNNNHRYHQTDADVHIEDVRTMTMNKPE